MAALQSKETASSAEEANDAEATIAHQRLKIEEFDKAIHAIVDVAAKREDRHSIECVVRSQLSRLMETEEKALASLFSRRDRTSKARFEEQIKHQQQCSKMKAMYYIAQEEQLREAVRHAKARGTHFAASAHERGMEACLFLVFRLWRTFVEATQQKATCDRLRKQVEDSSSEKIKALDSISEKATTKSSKRQASRENEPPKNGIGVTVTPPQANARRQNPQRTDRPVLQEPGETPPAVHTASAPDLFPPSVQTAMMARARAHSASASCLLDNGGVNMPPPPFAAPLLAAPKSPCFGEGRVAVNPPAWTGNNWTVSAPLAGCEGSEGRLSRGSSGGGSACANVSGGCFTAPPSRSQRGAIEAQASANALPGSPPLPPRLAEWQMSTEGITRLCGSNQRAHSASGRSLSPGPRGPSYSATSPQATSPRCGVASPRPGGTSPRQGSGMNSPRFPQPHAATNTGSAIATEQRGWESGTGSFPQDRARDDLFCGRRFFSGNPPPHTPPLSSWEVPQGPPPASPLPAHRPERGTLPKNMHLGQGMQGSQVNSQRPRSPRSSPLHSRPMRHGSANTVGQGPQVQPVYRRGTANGNTASNTGPVKPGVAQTQGSTSSTGTQGMQHSVAPHRDSRGMPAPGASFVAPPSVPQSSGSFVANPPPTTSTGSFVAAPQPQTQAAVRRGAPTHGMAPPYACVIRRAP